MSQNNKYADSSEKDFKSIPMKIDKDDPNIMKWTSERKLDTQVNLFAFSNITNNFIFAGDDTIYMTATNDNFKPYCSTITALDISRTGKYIVVGYDKGCRRVCIYKHVREQGKDTNEELYSFDHKKNEPVLAVKISNNDTYLFICFTKSVMLVLINKEKRELVCEQEFPFSLHNEFRFSKNNTVVLARYDNNKLVLWKYTLPENVMKSGTQITEMFKMTREYTFKEEQTALKFSTSGTILASGSCTGKVELFDWMAPNLTESYSSFQCAEMPVFNLNFSISNSYIAVGLLGGAEIFDLDKNIRVSKFERNTDLSDGGKHPRYKKYPFNTMIVFSTNGKLFLCYDDKFELFEKRKF